jgi:hypothetical protein
VNSGDRKKDSYVENTWNSEKGEKSWFTAFSLRWPRRKYIVFNVVAALITCAFAYPR